MVQTFLLFDTITNEKTVKFMQRDKLPVLLPGMSDF